MKGADLVFSIIYFLIRKKRPYERWSSAFMIYKFIAGHTQESEYKESRLARADKRSWLVAPMWWLWWNYWIEWSNKGIKVTPPPLWKKLVAENLTREKPIDNHMLYIQNRRMEKK